ncbi:MAG TPA: ATP-binding protein [Longimicrobiales bacterium]|nr:ATP-binding protein [Longimicrobiales bacterium]
MDVPFRIGEQVSGEFFTDRAVEVRRILQAMRSPTRLLVHGERRQGKSSAMRQAQARATAGGAVVAWVDVATIAGFGELADRLLPSIPWGWRLRERLQELLLSAHLRVEMRADAQGQPVLGVVPGRGAADAAEQKERFRSVVRALDRIASEEEVTVAVVLDEFQEVDRVLERGAWVLRDLMQTTSRLSWICAGSRVSLIETLIARDGPFHRFFEMLSFGAMEEAHLARWIEARMEGAGVRVDAGLGERIVAVAGPRTQDCLQLARMVFLGAAVEGRAGGGLVDDAFRTAVLEDADRFATHWDGLADSHRRVLRAVAAGETQLTGQEARERWGLPSSSGTTKAIRVLREGGFLDASTPARIDDPFFRGWVLLRAMPDGVPRGL